MTHDYEEALSRFPDISDHWETWANKTLSLSKEQYEATRSALQLAMDSGWRSIESAPRDGTVFWGWLNAVGIKKIRWITGDEIAEYYDEIPHGQYDGGWAEVNDIGEDWSPKLWLPLDAITQPPEASE